MSKVKMPNCPKCGSDRTILPWPQTNDRYECMACDHRFRPTTLAVDSACRPLTGRNGVKFNVCACGGSHIPPNH